MLGRLGGWLTGWMDKLMDGMVEESEESFFSFRGMTVGNVDQSVEQLGDCIYEMCDK